MFKLTIYTASASQWTTAEFYWGSEEACADDDSGRRRLSPDLVELQEHRELSHSDAPTPTNTWEEYNEGFHFTQYSCFTGWNDEGNYEQDFYLCTVPSYDGDVCTDLQFAPNDDQYYYAMYWQLFSESEVGSGVFETLYDEGAMPESDTYSLECIGETYPTAEPTTAAPTTDASQCFTLKMMDE